MPTTSPGSAASPAELKDMGNKLYTQRKYDEAIECYSAAIGKNSSVPTYFTNRALCYLKKSQWDLVIKDCKRALDLDPNLVKAHFFMGQALQELEAMDECVACLQRASDLARDNKQHFGDDIAAATRIAKRKRWNALEEKRIAEEIELQSYMNKLLREETERQLQRLTLPHGGETMTKATTATKTTTSSAEKTSSIKGDNQENGVEKGNASTTINCGESSSTLKVENTNVNGGNSKPASSSSSTTPSTSTSRESSFSATESKENLDEKMDGDETDKIEQTKKIDMTEKTDQDDKTDKTEDAGEKDPKKSSVGGIQDKVEGIALVEAVKSVDVEGAKEVKSNHVHSLTEEEIREQKRAIEAYHSRMESELHNLFTEIDDRRKKREVPDYLCGKISFDILRDPVITPSGITYERRDIEEHIQRVGHFDPVTRVTLTQDQLVPNFALKDVVDAFVAENAWAVDF